MQWTISERWEAWPHESARWSYSVQTLAQGFRGAMRKSWCPLYYPFPSSFSTSARLTDVIVVYISSSLALAMVVVKTRPCLTPPLPWRGTVEERKRELWRWEGRVVKTIFPRAPFPPNASSLSFPFSHCIVQPSCRCAPFYPSISAEESTFL